MALWRGASELWTGKRARKGTELGIAREQEEATVLRRSGW